MTVRTKAGRTRETSSNEYSYLAYGTLPPSQYSGRRNWYYAMLILKGDKMGRRFKY